MGDTITGKFYVANQIILLAAMGTYALKTNATNVIGRQVVVVC